MARLQIELPERWMFSTEIPVRITDVNYGGHVGNDTLLAVLQEARVQWLRQFGWTELIGEHTGLIMVEAAIRFKGEAVYGDRLRVRLATRAWTRLGFELVYLVEKAGAGGEVARAATGFVFFDYARRKLAPMPEGFRSRVAPADATN